LISVDWMKVHPIRHVVERRRRAARRGNADRRILHGESIQWRERELTSLRRRMQLARSLDSLVRELESASVPGASPVNRVAARRHLELVRLLGAILEDGGIGVEARGVILVDRLLLDGGGPLYDRTRAGELEPALNAAVAALKRSRPTS